MHVEFSFYFLYGHHEIGGRRLELQIAQFADAHHRWQLSLQNAEFSWGHAEEYNADVNSVQYCTDSQS